MSTIYGNTINHWRCYINTWSSEDSTSVSAGLTVGIQDCGWGFQIWTGIIGHASAESDVSEVNTSFNTPTGSWNTKDITSSSQRFLKLHNAYNITLYGFVRNQSGYMNGTSSASQILTIPALAHYYVSFDANGGSGAPGRVDKWYGENLTIPSQKPTRTNYEFLGWSKNSTGTVEYQSGKTYSGTPNASYTLYAVWKLLYVPPKFTDGLAIRTSSMTSTTSDYSGGYCYASFSYKVDTTIYPSNVAKSIVCKYYQNGSITGVVVTPTGDLNKASGTVNVHFPASINSVYYIECTLTDTKDGTATIARSITTGVLPMEVANHGKSVGILSAAPSSDGLKLGGSGNPIFLIASDTTNNKLESMVQIHGSTSSKSQGELTLSTQGIDSNGNIARGTISLIADNWKFNSQSFLPTAWVVVESDNKNPNAGWVWKKYGDGTAECWLKTTTSVFNITNKLSNGFYFNSGNDLITPRNYPFSFSEIPEELVNIDLQGESSGNSLTSWFSWYKKNTISTSKGYQVFVPSALNGVVAYLNYHVVGKYQ